MQTAQMVCLRLKLKTLAAAILICSVIAFLNSSAFGGLNADRLSSEDIKQVQTILKELEPLIQKQRQEQALAALTFDELYRPLDKKGRTFLKQFQSLDGSKLGIRLPFRGIASGQEELILIKNQKIVIDGKDQYLPGQFLPKQACQAYTAMMDAMQKDLQKRLYVQSGYRSSAYQLYLFISYLKNHNYSIKETARLTALPGYSEHGDPNHQAMDFINEAGIGQDRPKEFVKLAEYKWLLANAAKFGFTLSYPENSKEGIAFEPWHWRYDSVK
jgi:LAS superfamily LD-carboxypeptidase LdcB